MFKVKLLMSSLGSHVPRCYALALLLIKLKIISFAQKVLPNQSKLYFKI